MKLSEYKINPIWDGANKLYLGDLLNGDIIDEMHLVDVLTKRIIKSSFF